MFNRLSKAAIVLMVCAASTVWAAPPSASGTESAVRRTAPTGKPGAPIRVEFHQGKTIIPVGAAREIELKIVPLTDAESVQVTFEGRGGVVLQSGQSVAYETPTQARTVLTHRLQLSAATAGRHYIVTRATIVANGRASSRSMALPVVIGDPAKLAKARKEPSLPRDATGERVKSVPARSWTQN